MMAIVWKIFAYITLNTSHSLRKTNSQWCLPFLAKDPQRIWDQIEESIRSVYLVKEPAMIRSAKRFRSTRQFFEMVRFDFVVDDQLNVYLMEVRYK